MSAVASRPRNGRGRTRSRPTRTIRSCLVEKLWADSIDQGVRLPCATSATPVRIDLPRHLRLAADACGSAQQRLSSATRKDPKMLRYLPEVQAILLNIDRGGFAEAVIRMLIMMAESRGPVRRDRLERSAKVLGHDEPFASLGAGEARRADPRADRRSSSSSRELRDRDAAATCCRDTEERQQAIEVVEYIAGADRGNGARDDPAGAAFPCGARTARHGSARAEAGPAETDSGGRRGRPRRGRGRGGLGGAVRRPRRAKCSKRSGRRARRCACADPRGSRIFSFLRIDPRSPGGVRRGRKYARRHPRRRA